MSPAELVVAYRQQAALNHRRADKAAENAARWRKAAAEFSRKANLLEHEQYRAQEQR